MKEKNINDQHGTSVSQELSENIDIQKYLQILKKRWPVIVVAIVLCLALGIVYTLKMPKLYRSSASIRISSSAPRILAGVHDVAGVQNGYIVPNMIRTEIEVLKSRKVRMHAAEQILSEGGSRLAKIFKGKNKLTWSKKIEIIAKKLSKSIEVENKRKTNLLLVKAVDNDPKFAALMVNAIVSSFLNFVQDIRVSGAQEANDWLIQQQDDLKAKLNKSEANLHNFLQENDILSASITSKKNEIVSRLREFNSRLAAIQTNLIEDQENLAALKIALKDNNHVFSLREIRGAQAINTIKEDLISLNIEKKKLSEKYLVHHPKIKIIDKQITLLEDRLQKEIASVLVMLKRDEKSLLKAEIGLIATINKEKTKEAKINKLMLIYNQLNRDVETNSNLYELVNTRIKETNLTGLLKTSHVNLLDSAIAATSPFSPNWQKNLLLSLLLGILCGVGVIFLMELLDVTVKGQEDVEGELGQVFLGVFPSINNSKKDKKNPKNNITKAEKDLFLINHPKGLVAECIRAIRTNILFMSPDNKFKTVMVTSSLPQEGKTTASINLSCSMAQTGTKVLLVDTDLRRPRLHKTFEVANEVGITSLFVNDIDKNIDQAIVKTGMNNLDLLPCGPIPPNPSELFHTQKFKEILHKLKSMYQFIVFDSPPVAAVTDSVILGNYVDGAIVIAKTGVTRKNTLKQTMRTLQDAHVNTLGLILNDVDINTQGYGYYNGSYRYGRYYSYGLDPNKSYGENYSS